jgi:phenylalanyl-tRNA synthetase beta chain
MRVPLRWLSEFIDLPTGNVDELSYALDMLGHTVEGVERLEVGWSEVYVGEVLEVAEHPDADKIRVCQVDSGTGPTQIICGAWNFEAGATVAVARPGAVLPGDFEIGQRTIRGVESHGMICSERELGLGEDHAGILVLDEGQEKGKPFSDYVELPDVVLDLEVTPNRPDALSLVGIARDLAAWFDVDYRIPPVELKTVPGQTPISVEIADPSGCRRFTAREIRGVDVSKSPLRIRHRLHKVGTRSISNVVDVTNYVMFELGHPLHAFDAATIEGDRLVVKRAAEGETLETLDHVRRRLSPDDLIIYDDAGPTSMSGTMGGFRSEVSVATDRVLMEAASWDPPTIMHMWRRHDLRSEAATRFERGVDPNLADIANQRASAMVQWLCGGEVLEGSIDEVAIETAPWTVELAVSEPGRILGPGFDVDHVTGILERLGMTVDGGDPLQVTVPTFRPDITRPADLVEEIARVHGFDKFEATLPTGPAGGLAVEQRRLRLLNDTLVGIGITQAINLPFVGVEDMKALEIDTDDGGLLTVKNPLREEESKLRPSLLPGLLNALRYNRSHGISSVALFETGKVFFSTPDPDEPRLPEQRDRLAWAITGDVGLSSLEGSQRQADAEFSLAVWHRLADAMSVEAALEPATFPGLHPGRCAAIVVAGQTLGHVGELAPSAARAFDLDGRVAVADLELGPLLAPVEPKLATTPSPYPHVDFDLSFLVDEATPAADLVATTSTAANGLIESARVFDEFRGEALGASQKALAVTYRLRAPDRTLEQKEIASIRQSMIDAAESLGARLRGAE